MRLKVELDMETTRRLIRAAGLDNRPAGFEAEYILQQALKRRFAGEERQALPKEVTYAGAE